MCVGNESWPKDSHITAMKTELGTFGIFYFFNKKKWIFVFFIKLIWLGVEFLNRTGAEIGY